MRIPTVIIINDDNTELEKISILLRDKVRIYKRTSIQGEQLYGLREGLLYFDDKGDRQLILQDVYSEAIQYVEQRLAIVSNRSKELLNKYLTTRSGFNL